MKCEYIVIKRLATGWDGPETVYRYMFNRRDGDLYEGQQNLYWGTQHLTSCVMQPTDEVLHSFGYIDDMEDPEIFHNIVDQFHKMFPVLPHDIEKAPVKDADGFLAPDGRFFRTGWSGHSDMADILVEQENQDGHMDPCEDIYRGSRNSEMLYRDGWICVAHGYILMDYDLYPTEIQIKWLKRLAELNVGFKNYHQNVLDFLERALRRQKHA